MQWYSQERIGNPLWLVVGHCTVKKRRFHWMGTLWWRIIMGRQYLLAPYYYRCMGKSTLWRTEAYEEEESTWSVVLGLSLERVSNWVSWTITPRYLEAWSITSSLFLASLIRTNTVLSNTRRPQYSTPPTGMLTFPLLTTLPWNRVTQYTLAVQTAVHRMKKVKYSPKRALFIFIPVTQVK